MKIQLELLARLQEIDGQIDQHEANLKRLPLEVQEIAKNLVATRRLVTEMQERIEALEKDLRQKERDLPVEQEKIKRSERRLLSIKNQKEYNALSREVKLGKKVVGELEEAILELMGETENLKKIHERRQQEYSDLEQELTLKKELAERTAEEAKAALASLKDEKIRASKEIEAVFLKRYESVKKLRGAALAEMNDGTCSGCHMAVPAQINIQVLKQEEIVECPNCHRMLFVRPENIPEYNKLEL